MSRRTREQDPTPSTPEDRRVQLAARLLAERIRAGRKREAEYEALLDPRQRPGE